MSYKIEVFDTEVTGFDELQMLLIREDIQIHSIHTAGAAWADQGSGGAHHWVTVIYREYPK